MISLHLGLLMYLLGEHGGLKRVTRQPRDRALQLRLLVPLTRNAPPRAAAAPRRSVVIGYHTAPRALPKPAAPPVPTASPMPPSLPVSSRQLPFDARTGSDYIAGGSLLRRAASDTPPSVHLPGSGVPIVRGLHMVDPRMQGIGGVAHRLQALFGVPDKHCLQVDAWRGMSVRELLDRHLSPSQVERTAQRYGCGPG